ncbi:MAG: protein-export chaperone SecB [Rhodobacteraceae bacterium]|jgi:preprotein translocase subunit SecB|nr:MAG: protein-export chaperone SecB [Paracoccaceae bacterium]
MTDTDQQGNGAAAAATPPKVNMRILAQYMRDLSFENVAAQKKLQGGNVQPDIQVQVSLDAKKRETENQYEVGTKFKITSRNKTDGETLFLIELDYVGLFLIEGVPEGQLHPFLLIECPRMVFPFARRIISDISRDGGFPPLNLDTVDFLALYKQELQRQAAQKQAQSGETPATN